MDVKVILVLSLTFLAVYCEDTADDTATLEYVATSARLHDALMTGYNKRLIPVRNGTHGVKLKTGMDIIKIQDVNLHDGTITLLVWQKQMWKDIRLRWDAAEYGNMYAIHLPADELWKPDLTLYNSADLHTEVMETSAIVYSSGDVSFIPAIKVTALCAFDLTYFPYDVQHCRLKWGSWVYNGFQLDLDHYGGLKEIDMSSYAPHHEWQILESGAKKVNQYYDCCAEPYPNIEYNMTISRKGSYFSYSYVAPAVLCALLTSLTFLIPTGHNQKFTMGCCLLVVMTLLLVRIEEVLPRATARLPILVKYYVATFILLALAMALSCLTANMMAWVRTSSHPPAIIKKIIVDWLGRVLCVRRGDYYTLDEQFLIRSNGSSSRGSSSRTPSSLRWRTTPGPPRSACPRSSWSGDWSPWCWIVSSSSSSSR